MGPLCSFWSILTVHVGGLVNLVYKLAPATRVNLPSLYHGLAFSPWEFGWGGGGRYCMLQKPQLAQPV